MWKSWFQNQLSWWLWLSRCSSFDFASDQWKWWNSFWYWNQMCKNCVFSKIKFRNFLWWGNNSDLYEPYHMTHMRWFLLSSTIFLERKWCSRRKWIDPNSYHQGEFSKSRPFSRVSLTRWEWFGQGKRTILSELFLALPFPHWQPKQIGTSQWQRVENFS